jgi:hypothetical protein
MTSAKPRVETAKAKRAREKNEKFVAKREEKAKAKEAKRPPTGELEERPAKRLRTADTKNNLTVREFVETPPGSQDVEMVSEAEIAELKIQPHDLSPGKVVRLLPHLVVENGRITGLSFGRMRTPSPFGGRMGDHTGSWASVVDDTHSRLYNRTLRGAMEGLREAQDEVQNWMHDPGSVGMKLFGLLDTDDAESRRPVLEEYAYRVETLLAEVEQILDLDARTDAQNDKATEDLASAIAYHLAYQNFLPFATVPAQSAKGSTGSGEPAARAAVLRVEAAAEDKRQRDHLLENETPAEATDRETAEQAARDQLEADDKAAHPGERHGDRKLRLAAEEAQRLLDEAAVVPRAKRGLWDLFSFEAALREAGIELAVSPTKIQQDRRRIRLAVDDAKELMGMFAPYANPKKAGITRAKFVPKIPVDTKDDFLRRLKRIESEGKEVHDADTGYREVHKLSDVLRETAELMQRVSGEAPAQDVDDIARGQQKIEYLLPLASEILTSLTAKPDAARERCAYLLGSLVHEHQTRMARAYPDTVAKTDFLGDDPGQALADELRDQIHEYALGFEDDQVTALLARISELYEEFGATPEIGESTRWVADAKTEGLVVSFSGNTIRIQGRAPAPYGVGGMGSHSTAWVTEVGVVEKALGRVGKAGLAKELQRLAKADLEGDLLDLDWLLAGDQLNGGQLNSIFDNAAAVLNATEPEEAVRAYLCFRNVLPYATVDAGNRGGSGERKNATQDKVLDETSLKHAAEQKQGEFDDDRVQATINAMTKAADALKDALKDDVADHDAATAKAKKATDAGLDAPPDPPQNWASATEIKTAVEASIERMKSQAEVLQEIKDAGRRVDYDVAATVLGIRRAEHAMVYEMATAV